jgi:hypothetical protein
MAASNDGHISAASTISGGSRVSTLYLGMAGRLHFGLVAIYGKIFAFSRNELASPVEKDVSPDLLSAWHSRANRADAVNPP